MTRRLAGLLIAPLVCAACAGTASAAKPHGDGDNHQGDERKYQLTFQGTQSESYSASDTTPFNVQGRGLVGCAYTQEGDTTVAWKNVWDLPADVKEKTGHIKLGQIDLKSGPADPKNPGKSEISGTNSDGENSTTCSDEGLAGQFDCTAEAVVPSRIHGVPFKPDFAQAGKKAWTVTFPAYDLARASYEESGATAAPASYGCGAGAGQDSAPGGFLMSQFGIGAAEVRVRITHNDLISMERNSSVVIDFPDSLDTSWVNQAFPAPGLNCAPKTEDTDEACEYTDPTALSGSLRVTRFD